jgi:TPR repeat protein
VLPPQDFIGAIDLGVELRLADDAVADRRTVRLEWAPPPPAAAAAEPAVRSLDRDEIATLIKRSEDFIAAGDLAAARVLLRRAAEARDAGAALALAATYDPIVLERLKVYGFSADVDTARAWYEKAKEFGSAEAPRRLELLASQTR